MNPERLTELLDAVRDGRLAVADALERLRDLPFEDLGFALVDHHRSLRKGFPEVIYCAGKTPEQVEQIARRLVASGELVLATRADEATAAALQQAFSDQPFAHNPRARTVVIGEIKTRPECATVLIVAAGTSDIPVAEEAAVTASCLGCPVETLIDVGVAGLHRLLHYREQLDRAGAIVVVAGFEGALPSVVGGLVRGPVVAVPTSVGYGASFGGLSALLAMLNSCAPGVTVVNIDNGFGAGYAAALIAAGGAGRAR